jgi:predicted Fe-S protein YdhL (DUF1289 family)
MAQTTETVKNPCKGICRFNTKVDLCVGCYRHKDEKSNWPTMSNTLKLLAVSLCFLRKTKWPKMQSGWIEPDDDKPPSIADEYLHCY